MLSGKFSSQDKDNTHSSGNYKSCFARSMVVNSLQKHKQTAGTSLQAQQLLLSQLEDSNNKGADASAGEYFLPGRTSSPLHRDCSILGSGKSSSNQRSSSVCSPSRISEMPVENLVLKSQIETLQWQLKQTEESREMYKAVMREVVAFLERAQRSLQMLGSRIGAESVVRTLSDYNIVELQEQRQAATDYSSLREYTWGRHKKSQPPPDDTQPEKLSQEAFRLLRTAQSLLSTAAPDLAQINIDKSAEIQFLEQLAKEFPRTCHEDNTESLSLSSLQYTPPSEKDMRIATAFNRKLSLQHTLVSKNQSPISSVGSAEDESGFSSLNSFQELGIPMARELGVVRLEESEDLLQPKTPEQKLWQKPSSNSHKRWSSNPATVTSKIEDKEPLKVLWV